MKLNHTQGNDSTRPERSINKEQTERSNVATTLKEMAGCIQSAAEKRAIIKTTIQTPCLGKCSV